MKKLEIYKKRYEALREEMENALLVYWIDKDYDNDVWLPFKAGDIFPRFTGMKNGFQITVQKKLGRVDIVTNIREISLKLFKECAKNFSGKDYFDDVLGKIDNFLEDFYKDLGDTDIKENFGLSEPVLIQDLEPESIFLIYDGK